MIRNTVILLIFSLFGLHTHQVAAQQMRTEISVDFRVNETDIDPAYRENQKHLNEIIAFLQNVSADTTITVLEVSFCGAASPEGSYQFNRELAHGRLSTLEKLVREHVYIPEEIITRNDQYIPWQHLREEVAVSDLDNKAEILEILDQESTLVQYVGDTHIDSRLDKIRRLDGGRTWRKMNQLFFAPMRNASAVLVTLRQTPPKPEPKPQPQPQPEPQPEPVVVEPAPEPVEEPMTWTRRIYAKTNAIGWALLIGNAALEVDLAEQWSVTLPVYYSACNYFTQDIKFRTLAIQPEVRYWLRPAAVGNDGWFVGAHASVASYNLAVNGGYRVQDHNQNTPAIGGGLSIGYRMPLCANNRWHVEFSLGAGVYALKYDKYVNEYNGRLIDTTKKTYIGLDNAAVTFSYAFDLGKKGGRK
ncbi:MAG: DUF3575 domain-containing protein [Muribaculaceae bacterium]|nr:DUF3575 domain-containing protein [Muribaculaceae bacterium]